MSGPTYCTDADSSTSRPTRRDLLKLGALGHIGNAEHFGNQSHRWRHCRQKSYAHDGSKDQHHHRCFRRQQED